MVLGFRVCRFADKPFATSKTQLCSHPKPTTPSPTNTPTPTQYVYPTDSPNLAKSLVAQALSPFMWAKHHPDLFDTWSAGIVLLCLALPSVRAERGLVRLLEEFERAEFDLDRWRAGCRWVPARDFAALDADNGAGWSLAAGLLRPRNIKVGEDGSVKFVAGGGFAPRLSAAEALKHRFCRLAAQRERAAAAAAAGAGAGGRGGGDSPSSTGPTAKRDWRLQPASRWLWMMGCAVGVCACDDSSVYEWMLMWMSSCQLLGWFSLNETLIRFGGFGCVADSVVFQPSKQQLVSASEHLLHHIYPFLLGSMSVNLFPLFHSTRILQSVKWTKPTFLFTFFVGTTTTLSMAGLVLDLLDLPFKRVFYLDINCV